MVRHVIPALALALLLATDPGLAAEQPDTVSLEAYGTATVDGIHSPGEWQSAAVRTFQANVPAGGTTGASFYAMNDGTHLYVALSLPNWSVLANSSMSVTFDNNDNGVCDAGEDALTMNAINPTTLLDSFWTAACADNFQDSGQGGTTDGIAKVVASAPSSFWEISHPLNDADNAHDFSLPQGNVVGFSLLVALCGGGCGYTWFPASAWGFFGEITVAGSDWIFSDGFVNADLAAWSDFQP
jgi:hypothetical protein